MLSAPPIGAVKHAACSSACLSPPSDTFIQAYRCVAQFCLDAMSGQRVDIRDASRAAGLIIVARQELPEGSPYSRECSVIEGKLALYTGQQAKAVQHLEEALAGGPLPKLGIEARSNLVVALWQTNQLDKAVETCQEACTTYPEEARFREALGNTLAQKAQELETTKAQKDEARTLYEKSIEAFQHACKIDPCAASSYQGWVKQLAALRRPEEERQVAQAAIDRGLGIYLDAMQRPEHLRAGLASKPWHDPKDFPWCQVLEQNFQAIQEELLAVISTSEAWPSVTGHELALARTGEWHEIVMLGSGSERGHELCPVTAGLLKDILPAKRLAEASAACGNSIFSKLTPGTHLQAHCGPTNTRLTCHFAVEVPEGCEIRVGFEKRQWEQGKCLVFDDSWEHEVWHNGNRDRVVLLINFWHPDLAEDEWAHIEQEIYQLSRCAKF